MDLGIGEVFNTRLAGNIVNDDVLGGMEFACKLSGAKVILVMGHTRCGAVAGAIAGAELGNLTGLLKKIEPAVGVTKYEGERKASNYGFVDAVAQDQCAAADRGHPQGQRGAERDGERQERAAGGGDVRRQHRGDRFLGVGAYVARLARSQRCSSRLSAPAGTVSSARRHRLRQSSSWAASTPAASAMAPATPRSLAIRPSEKPPL